ncbi:hypothetical protein E6C27_scaffold43G00990 [Cucumis melo var. makuwa]|uniref:Uncharacterized protein n=1 Tax=Cucumis melo var. makuwa TaxID=1194695 RepID=A0A5A7U0F7_CUCMM|nr:hypothetical protein E6C27_scaffold43G00990 [Cucumis melo var. makuwa]
MIPTKSLEDNLYEFKKLSNSFNQSGEKSIVKNTIHLLPLLHPYQTLAAVVHLYSPFFLTDVVLVSIFHRSRSTSSPQSRCLHLLHPTHLKSAPFLFLRSLRRSYLTNHRKATLGYHKPVILVVTFLTPLALNFEGHLCYLITDVPPQPNSPPDSAFHLDWPSKESFPAHPLIDTGRPALAMKATQAFYRQLMGLTGSRLRPLCLTLRGNLFPEVMDSFCRLLLPTLFHRPEVVHLRDMMRL